MSEEYFNRKDDVAKLPDYRQSSTIDILNDVRYLLNKNMVEQSKVLVDVAIASLEMQNSSVTSRKIEITDEALDDLVDLINTAKANGLLDTKACISANRDELTIDLTYRVTEEEDIVKSIYIKLKD